MRPYAIFLITLLLLLQNVQLFMCRQLASKRRQTTELAAPAIRAGGIPMKRTISGAGAGQAEELLQQQAGDQIESNYDEYPMVVPKRAALLLDRLMMALHRALEKENSERQRFVDVYTSNNNNNNNNIKYKGEREEQPASDFNQDADFDQSSSYMYSDDDPSVLMDYDFKDLNSINRATGESLMAKGFQRRAHGMEMMGGSSGSGGGDDFRSTPAGGDHLGSSSSIHDGAGRNAMTSNGHRLYWRCYFNAVSCF